MYIKSFKNEHIKFIYERAKQSLDSKKEWIELDFMDTAFQCHIEAQTLVELLEVIFTGQTGDGIFGWRGGKHCKNLEERLESFAD